MIDLGWLVRLKPFRPGEPGAVNAGSVTKNDVESRMIKYLLRLLIVFGMVLLGVACATKRPVLYPNERLQAVGPEVAERDIDECLRLAAEKGLDSSKGKEVAGQASVGAAGGAAVGAAVGAVTGHPGRGAVAGAAGGGTAGFLRGLFQSRDLDPIQRRFIEECLRQKGYKVIGWR